MIIREASFFSRWELTQRPQTGQYTGVPWNIQPSMGCLHQISPLRGQRAMWRKRWKTVRVSEDDGHQGNRAFETQ